MDVRQRLKQRGNFCGLISGVMLISLFGACANVVHAADFTSGDITIDLGPGNEDIEKKLKDWEGFSNAPAAFKRVWGYDLSGRDLRQAQLHLAGFTLRDVNFSGADFTGADLAETVFDNCSFRNAILRKVDHSGGQHLSPTCDLSGADISGSRMRLTKAQLTSTKNYREKDLSDTILVGDFRGMCFAGFTLRGTAFMCKIEGCDFTNADISDCRIRLTKEQLLSTKNYKERHLDGIEFVDCQFRGVDFSGHNLPYFVKCDLQGADFSNACFMSSRRMSFLLPSRNSGFRDCRFSAKQFYSTRTYKSGKMPPSCGIGNMDLRNWDFSGMDLRHVRFPQCSLQGADLTDVRGGLFEHATGLTVEQIKQTTNYQHGKLNEPGFSLPEEIKEALLEEDEGAD